MRKLFGLTLLGLGACCAAEPDQWERQDMADYVEKAKYEALTGENADLKKAYETAKAELEAAKKQKPEPKQEGIDKELLDITRPYVLKGRAQLEAGDLGGYKQTMDDMTKVTKAYRIKKLAEEMEKKEKEQEKKEAPKQPEQPKQETPKQPEKQ